MSLFGIPYSLDWMIYICICNNNWFQRMNIMHILVKAFFMLASILWITRIYSQVSFDAKRNDSVVLIVLGNVQDAGSPHIGCTQKCCANLWEHADKTRKITSLGVIDGYNQSKWLFEATPDIATQLKVLKNYSSFSSNEIPNGIFLTHAHIGHYTGLMYFGKEGMNAKSLPVYLMPRFKTYLETNGPWSQLVQLKNIELNELTNQREYVISNQLKITPVLVPHRDEFSETVGYRIQGPTKSAIFIPDIDKWEKWDRDIIAEIAKVDFAFIDGTFYDQNELPNRKMNEIPHPFVVESMTKFASLPDKEKNKIYFIHLNHSNPVLVEKSQQSRQVEKKGFHIARFGQKFVL